MLDLSFLQDINLANVDWALVRQIAFAVVVLFGSAIFLRRIPAFAIMLVDAFFLRIVKSTVGQEDDMLYQAVRAFIKKWSEQLNIPVEWPEDKDETPDA